MRNVTTQDIELTPLDAKPQGAALFSAASLPFLKSVKVTVTVRVGQTEMSVGDLLDVKQGGVLKLDRLVDQALDVLVDEHVVARGTLVAVGDHFGIRLSEAPSMTAAKPDTRR